MSLKRLWENVRPQKPEYIASRRASLKNQTGGERAHLLPWHEVLRPCGHRQSLFPGFFRLWRQVVRVQAGRQIVQNPRGKRVESTITPGKSSQFTWILRRNPVMTRVRAEF